MKYRVYCDLDLGTDRISKAWDEMCKSPLVGSLLKELDQWPGHALKRHNDAKLLIHKLSFLADIGIDDSLTQVSAVIAKILEHISAEGVVQTLQNIPNAFGGSGVDEYNWIICDAPVVMYPMIKLGYKKQMQSSIDYLVSTLRDNGWPCVASPSIKDGKFKGPGKREDPCPYSTLLMIKVLTLLPEYTKSTEIKTGIHALLDLWNVRKERKPYLFAMGTRFTKLKAPLIWYDILHVLDVLSNIPETYQDPRVKEMVDIVVSKADDDGKFKAESVWRPWNDWDFGQKRVASHWISFLVYRILHRYGTDIKHD